MQDFLGIDLFNYHRRIASVVKIGDIPMGGTNPIRLQSMTNTPTLNTLATVEQCKRVFVAGADYVRITTPGIRDAENLKEIKKELLKAGYKKPLVADVHFNPDVAELAAQIVEKVRINPGNYVDKKRSGQVCYDEKEYKFELERIYERVLPLLTICKQHGTAIRVGVNHGSLSDRIMNRYGDTPEGMVESAMEFLRIFDAESFKQTVISMKSSNTRVMVQSTRLLVKRMLEEGMNYPVHLGVTEAGEGEDGVIKSAVGISALLADGIGETIRVSLTGDPEQEIPVARNIVECISQRKKHKPIISSAQFNFSPYSYHRRETEEVNRIGGNHTHAVVAADLKMIPSENDLYFYPEDQSRILFRSGTTMQVDYSLAANGQLDADETSGKIVIIPSGNDNSLGEARKLISQLQADKLKSPVIFRKLYNEKHLENLNVKAACDFGPLLIDGLIDGVWIENEDSAICNGDIYQLSLSLLQASRLRMSKTEYISCPSCGRTLFDLSATTAKIREQTSHLKHLKIGIMGCIVNGPGEMADADYGYVGTGAGKITLYKNKTVVKRNIPEENAVKELIDLIKENGDWVDV